VVDLFSGAGGIAEGFRQAGYRVIAGSDVDPDAMATFARNFPEAETVHGDIRIPAIHERVAAAAKYADVIVGGPPCQAFSQMRNHTRVIDDPRNSLYREFVSIVGQSRPRAFLMENVTGLDQMGVREQIISDLTLDGEYNVRAQVIDAADFGVPQTRKRLFFIGVRRSLLVAPPLLLGSGATSGIGLARTSGRRSSYELVIQEEILANGLSRSIADPEDLSVVTVAQAIGDLADLPVGNRDDELEVTQLPAASSAYQRQMRAGLNGVLSNVQVPRINEDTRLRLAGIPAGGNYRDLHERLTKRYLTGQRWGQDNGSGKLSRRHFYAYRRLHPEIWAWTLNTKGDAVYHYLHARSLSVREFARLQSFPDAFVFTTDPAKGMIPGRIDGGPAHSRYRQVGNAVPPLLARAAAVAVRSILAEVSRRKTA
jgi:DNA (cytosine-5)-methyltransferase 1